MLSRRIQEATYYQNIQRTTIVFYNQQRCPEINLRMQKQSWDWKRGKYAIKTFKLRLSAKKKHTIKKKKKKKKEKCERPLFIIKKLTTVGSTACREKEKKKKIGKENITEKRRRVLVQRRLFLTILRDTKRLTNFCSFIAVACVYGRCSFRSAGADHRVDAFAGKKERKENNHVRIVR